MYASLFEMSGALHLDVFEQPEKPVFFSNLKVPEMPKMPRVTEVSTRLKVQEKSKHNAKRKNLLTKARKKETTKGHIFSRPPHFVFS
jgi:hypothetical protein